MEASQPVFASKPCGATSFSDAGVGDLVHAQSQDTGVHGDLREGSSSFLRSVHTSWSKFPCDHMCMCPQGSHALPRPLASHLAWSSYTIACHGSEFTEHV